MSLAAVALRAAGPPARRFPRLARWIAGSAAVVAWRTRGGTRQRVIGNLLPFCDGDRARAKHESRRVLRNIADYYVELLTLPNLDIGSIEGERLVVAGREHLAVLDATKPVIVMSAHTGNPEIAIQGLLGRGRPFVAMVEELADRPLAHELLRLRRSLGGDFVEATPQGLLHVVRALRGGGVAGLIGDRDLQGGGVCVNLAGRAVRLPRAPWELARRTNSIVLPGFCSRLTGGRLGVRFEEPFEVDKTVEPERAIVMAAGHWASLFERHLRSDPGQWAVIEDYWANHACGEPGLDEGRR